MIRPEAFPDRPLPEDRNRIIVNSIDDAVYSKITGPIDVAFQPYLLALAR